MTKSEKSSPRRVNPRRLILLGTAAATGIAVAAPAYAASGQIAGASTTPPIGYVHVAAAKPGDEGGEGGESGAARAGGEDPAFLADLAYIEGHLRAGIALYEAGATAMAATHMKHPEDEIYANLNPQLASRGAEQFDRQLVALAEAVEGGAPIAEVKDAFAAVSHEIEEAREKVGGGESVRMKAIVLIVRKAAAEFAEGVKNGQVVEMHEYQDAWGFVQAARAMTDALDTSSRPDVKTAVDRIRTQLDRTTPAFPSLQPGKEAKAADASVIFGAAARMEIAALAVK